MGRIVVLTVAYRSSLYLEHLLSLLQKATIDEVVLVDNFSTHSERRRVEELAKKFSEVKFILLEENIGFGAGVNLAFQEAQPSSDDLILLLNPDVSFTVDAVKYLAQQLRSNQIDILSPTIFKDQFARKPWYRGGRISKKLGITFMRGRLSSSGEHIAEVSFLPATFVMMKAEVFRRLAGFREDFFLYWEDADFCLRATAAGFKMGCELSVEVLHRVGGSGASRRKSPEYFYYMAKNRRALFLSKTNVHLFGRMLFVAYDFFLLTRAIFSSDERRSSLSMLFRAWQNPNSGQWPIRPAQYMNKGDHDGSKIEKVFVLYPKGAQTGGPESLHQLVRELREIGLEAYLVPTSRSRRRLPVPEYELHGAPEIARVEDKRQNLVISSDFSFADIARIRHAKRAIWWLGVDYSMPFRARSSWSRSERPSRYLRHLLRNALHGEWLALAVLRARGWRDIFHLAQSDHCVGRLRDLLGIEAWPLSSPTGFRLRRLGLSWEPDFNDSAPRVIAYNPKKDSGRVSELKKALPDYNWVPLVGMNSEQCLSELSKAHLYIDLGFFPGRERLPREAAQIGVPILVSRIGAASNPRDYPLPDEFKVRLGTGWLQEAKSKVQKIALDPVEAARTQHDFQAGVLEQDKSFRQELVSFLNDLELGFGQVDKNFVSSNLSSVITTYATQFDSESVHSPEGGLEAWVADFIDFSDHRVRAVKPIYRRPRTLLSGSFGEVSKALSALRILLQYRKSFSRVVLLHEPIVALFASYILRKSKIILVMHNNFGWHINRLNISAGPIAKWLYLKLESAALSRSYRVFTQAANDFERLLQIRPDANLLLGWYNDRVFHPRRSVPAERKKQILWVGRLSGVKDPALAVLGFSKAAKNESFDLLIVGSGPLEEPTRNLVRELGVGNRVTTVSPTSRFELAHLMSESVVFLHTAKTEATPRIFLEALAMGLPIITVARADPEYWGKTLGSERIEVAEAASVAAAIDRIPTQRESRVPVRLLARRASEVVPALIANFLDL